MNTLIIGLHELQEAVAGMTVMAGVRLERELTMHKDDGIPLFQEEFCRRGSTSSCAEVVDESHRLCLQWHCCSSTLFTFSIFIPIGCESYEGRQGEVWLVKCTVHPRSRFLF